MVKSFLSLFLKLLSLGTVTVAAFLWADAAVDDRPKFRDEQTLIGGMVWSQLIILVGLIISDALGEDVNVFVHGYYLLSGIVICGFTGVFLMIDECRMQPRHEELHEHGVATPSTIDVYSDRMYISIGLISFVACFLILADFSALLYNNVF